MKKYYVFTTFFLTTILFMFYLFWHNSSKIILADNLPSDITASPVFATLPKGSVLYDNCNGKAIDMLLSGSRVEIIKDKSRKWYYIRYKNKLGWVKAEALKIPKDTRADKSEINKENFLNYANSNLKSETNHYVWVDILRQKVYILKKENSWVFEKIFTCSSGKNTSPSLRGQYKISDRGLWFYSDRLGSGGKYWVRYNGSYLFHSVAMDINKNIIDPTLGEKSSNGCIRLGVNDAKWFYYNIEENTAVTIN